MAIFVVFLGVKNESGNPNRAHLLGGSAFFSIVGVALLVVVPPKPSLQPASAVSAQ